MTAFCTFVRLYRRQESLRGPEGCTCVRLYSRGLTRRLSNGRVHFYIRTLESSMTRFARAIRRTQELREKCAKLPCSKIGRDVHPYIGTSRGGVAVMRWGIVSYNLGT
jgi:hypothetical protein